jgi:hypothetical protein
MGILSNAIIASAGVSSGQLSAQEAAGSLGLSGEQHDRMVDLFEAEERSLRASGSLSADLNSVQSRERRALLDAQVAYHNDLQSHLESVNDLNADNWNKAQDRWVDISTSLDKRDADLAKARSNVNNAAIDKIRGAGSSVSGQWTQLTGYLGIDGKALNDSQLFATLNSWRSQEGNENFLPADWKTASSASIRAHLANHLTPGQVNAAMNSVSRAKNTYNQIIIAEEQVAQTRATLTEIQQGGGDFDTTETQNQLNKLRGQLDQMLVAGDPTTGITAQNAIQEHGAMMKGFELLKEQEEYRRKLNAASPSERDSMNKGLGGFISKPAFQKWAEDNGFKVGYAVNGSYFPGKHDQLAVLAFRQEDMRGMHRYGISGGRTGEVLEIRVGGTPVQMYDVDGTMMTLAQVQAQYPDQTVSVNESGQLTIDRWGESHDFTDDPNVDGLYPGTTPGPRVFEKGPMTATETVVVERARMNATRMMKDPGKIEVFMPDGTIRVIEPDDVVQTIRDPSTEASMSEQQRRESRMRRRSRLWNRLVNSGLIDQIDEEDYMIDPDIDAGTMSRRDARRAERAALDMTDAEREAQARLDSVGADVSTLPEEGTPGEITDDPTAALDPNERIPEYSATLDVDSTVQVDPETGEITYDEEAERSRLRGIGLPDDVIDRIFAPGSNIDPSTIGRTSTVGGRVQDVQATGGGDIVPPETVEVGGQYYRRSDFRRTTEGEGEDGIPMFLQLERDADGNPTGQYLVYRGDPTTAEGSLESIGTTPSSPDIEELFEQMEDPLEADPRPPATYTVSDIAAQRGDTVVYRTINDGNDKVIELTDSGAIIYGDQVIEPGDPDHESFLQLVEDDRAASTERQMFTTSSPMATDDTEVELEPAQPPEAVTEAAQTLADQKRQEALVRQKEKEQRQQGRRDRRQSVLDMLRGRREDTTDPSIQEDTPVSQIEAPDATPEGLAETLDFELPDPERVRAENITQQAQRSFSEIGAGLEGLAAGRDAGVFATEEGADVGETREDRQSQRRLMRFIRGIGKGN